MEAISKHFVQWVVNLTRFSLKKQRFIGLQIESNLFSKYRKRKKVILNSNFLNNCRPTLWNRITLNCCPYHAKNMSLMRIFLYRLIVLQFKYQTYQFQIRCLFIVNLLTILFDSERGECFQILCFNFINLLPSDQSSGR